MKLANAWFLARIVLIDILLSLKISHHLLKIIFPFPLTPAVE